MTETNETTTDNGATSELDQLRNILMAPFKGELGDQLEKIDSTLSELKTQDEESAQLVRDAKEQLSDHGARLKSLEERLEGEIMGRFDTLISEIQGMRAQLEELRAEHTALDVYTKKELSSQITQAQDSSGALPEMLIEIADRLRNSSRPKSVEAQMPDSDQDRQRQRRQQAVTKGPPPPPPAEAKEAEPVEVQVEAVEEAQVEAEVAARASKPVEAVATPMETDAPAKEETPAAQVQHAKVEEVSPEVKEEPKEETKVEAQQDQAIPRMPSVPVAPDVIGPSTEVEQVELDTGLDLPNIPIATGDVVFIDVDQAK